MTTKKVTTTKKGPATKKNTSEELAKTARKVFEATEKNAYYLGNRAINNFVELRENIHEFREEQAPWVADWLEYIGDKEVAKNIRKAPQEFKQIVISRYDELKKSL